jgi:hypothetical protein
MIAAALRYYLSNHPLCAAAGGRIAPQTGTEAKRGERVPTQLVFVQTAASSEQLEAIDDVVDQAEDQLTTSWQFHCISTDYDEADEIGRGLVKALNRLSEEEIGEDGLQVRIINTELETAFDDFDEQNGLFVKFVLFKITHEI